MRMGKDYTDAQKEATKKYLNKLKNLSIRVKPEEAERFKREAAKRNMSLRAFVLSSINEKIEREDINNEQS